jgi:hypothetical protein
MSVSRQKLPLAGPNSVFRFTPKSRPTSEIESCLESANSGPRD